MNSINVVKGWIREFIDLALLFIAVGVVVQIIFGPDVEYFSAITKNLMAFISELGTEWVRRTYRPVRDRLGIHQGWTDTERLITADK